MRTIWTIRAIRTVLTELSSSIVHKDLTVIVDDQSNRYDCKRLYEKHSQTIDAIVACVRRVLFPSRAQARAIGTTKQLPLLACQELPGEESEVLQVTLYKYKMTHYINKSKY